MISRRGIRIKVMQNLYAFNLLQEPSDSIPEDRLKEAQKNTIKYIENSGQSLAQVLYVLYKVVRYASIDADKRASKLLPTAADKNVSTKITHSHFFEYLSESEEFKKVVRKQHLENTTEKELIKRIYGLFIEKEAYQSYIKTRTSDRKEDKKILIFLLTEILMEDEDFDQFMADHYLQWDDDKQMVSVQVQSALDRPETLDLSGKVSNIKKEFAGELFRTVLEKKEVCLEWIKPRLQNWDPDRVALIDMLLLYMGVSEFLYFSTIPPKVTINEYIDLGKMYSTPQSGHFINGVLDNILKDLKAKKKLQKTEKAKE